MFSMSSLLTTWIILFPCMTSLHIKSIIWLYVALNPILSKELITLLIFLHWSSFLGTLQWTSIKRDNVGKRTRLGPGTPKINSSSAIAHSRHRALAHSPPPNKCLFTEVCVRSILVSLLSTNEMIPLFSHCLFQFS